MACIVGNFFSAFPFRSDIKWIVLFIISVAAFLRSNYKKYRTYMMFAFFVFVIFFFLPLAFMDSGGSSNNAIGYIFLILICITYLFSGWRRIFLVAGLIVVFMLLHVLEYFHPEFIMVYTGWNQFVDRMIQIPLLLLVAFFIILWFAKEYERVNAKLDQYASMDALTGLYNRRMFDKAIEEAIADRRNMAYLVLIDMDNFKQVNDTYGHSAGDEALQKLAVLLQDSLGHGRNVVSRWGGDEFAVIYYGDGEELTRCLEEIEQSFQEYMLSYNETTGISFSITLVREDDRADQVLTRADRLLYAEKQRKHVS